MSFRLLPVFLAACHVPPVWSPGDPPVTVYATPEVREAVVMGCAKWLITGFACLMTDNPNAADITAIAKPLGKSADGLSYREERLIVIDSAVLVHPEYAWAVAGHELGHQMGIPNLPQIYERPALMSSPFTSFEVTERDLEAFAKLGGDDEDYH